MTEAKPRPANRPWDTALPLEQQTVREPSTSHRLFEDFVVPQVPNSCTTRDPNDSILKCLTFFRGPTPAIHFGTLWPDCWRPPLRSRKLATLPSPSCWTLETCTFLTTGTLTSSTHKCSGLDSSSLLHCQESSPPCPEGETSA